MRGSGLLCSLVQLKQATRPYYCLSFDKWALYSDICVGLNVSYVQDLVCVMCGSWSVLCVVFSLCYVQSLVGVMCSVLSVLFAVCVHELGRFAPSMLCFAWQWEAQQEPKGKAPVGYKRRAQPGSKGRNLGPAPPTPLRQQTRSSYIYIYICIYIYIYMCIFPCKAVSAYCICRGMYVYAFYVHVHDYIYIYIYVAESLLYLSNRFMKTGTTPRFSF